MQYIPKKMLDAYGGEECSLELWPVLLQVRDSESACGHSMCVHTDTWDEKPQIINEFETAVLLMPPVLYSL